MIKTLIFDFGDVFINLDKEGAMKNALNLFKIEMLSEEATTINNTYEQGLISTEEFITYYLKSFPKLSRKEIIDSWNYILLDFPEERLRFIKNLAQEKKYGLLLLSNTNELHINWIKNNFTFYNQFKNCFDAFYLSHEIQLRKPNTTIFEYIIKMNNLIPKECLFIDDTKENTDSANKLGFHVWNNNPKDEDVIDLFTIKKDLF